MVRKAKADIIPVVRYTCMALQSFARSKGIEILFRKSNNIFNCEYNPGEIMYCLSQLLCRIIALLPARSKVTIDTSCDSNNGLRCLKVIIRNTGPNLSTTAGITNNLTPSVIVDTAASNESRFTVLIATADTVAVVAVPRPLNSEVKNSVPFYEAVRKRLQVYFTRTDNYLGNLQAMQPGKAAFLTKINDCITQNLSDENFDVTSLSKEMTMSRTQLFRKLKPIISQAPANYIRDVRLQKAKELLEVGNLSVSEVAYKTGFKTPSHFTRVFTEKYGIRPSYIGISKRM